MYKPNSFWTWAFLLITSFQAAIILAFEAYVFAVFLEALTPASYAISEGDTTDYGAYTRTIPTFLSLFIFGMIYEMILVWDALRMKNTIQIIGLCMHNIGLVVYAGIQWDELQAATDFLSSTLTNPNIWDDISPFLISIPCVLGLGTVLMTIAAWKLYDEFAWAIYRHISADLRMKRRYLAFQIYIALLKFDFFFFLGFTIQFIVVVVNRKDSEFGLTIAAIPITIGILLMAAYWTKKENKFGAAFIIFLYFAALAYFIFKLVRMYFGPKVTTYLPVRKTLTTFAVITVILIVITIGIAIRCTMNFNKGLKPHIARQKIESEEEKGYMTEMPNLGQGPVNSRMTID